MPELPEVETIVRGLRDRLEGRRIEDVEATSSRVVQGPISQLTGARITAVGRHGKFVLIGTTAARLTIHLGMTGALLLDSPRTAYTRAIFTLDSGLLQYHDIRQFGRLELDRDLAALGPDALNIDAATFTARFLARTGAIKPLLLNQSFLAGLGNIYVDEALHRAGLHPRSQPHRKAAARLHTAIAEVLREAIAAGGSSISDYVDADGNRGGYQRLHRVYGREGQPCPGCSTPIRRIVIAQRGTHYCPRCQRLH